jgi:hypothetical protein
MAKPAITTRSIQIVLGLIWLFDGLLQLQHGMFTSAFATTVLAPAAFGQPVVVAALVHWGVHIILLAPAAWDTLFAAVQLLIGFGLLWPKTVKPAIALSVLWGVGIWIFGEGLGGLASGSASLITGAPGAVLLYVILGLALWPVGASNSKSQGTKKENPQAPAVWLSLAWCVLWIGGAILTLLPAQRSALATTNLTMNQAMAAPTKLMNFDASVNNHILSTGSWFIVVFCLVQALIGIGGLFQKTRPWAAWVGMGLAFAFWAIGQSFGMLFTGLATDPNSGPLFILMGVALLGVVGEIWPVTRLSIDRSDQT